MPVLTRSRYSLTLLLLIAVAFSLRLFRLEAQSLWYDEGVTAMVAQLGWVEMTRWTANDIQPPLYYFVIGLWGRLVGWSEWSLRFPSVFFGTLTVPLMAAVAVRLSQSKMAGIVAALLATLHPLLLYYSQEARMYAMLTTLALLAAYAVVVYRSRSNSALAPARLCACCCGRYLYPLLRLFPAVGTGHCPCH
jgi:mannosyltransferase